MEKDIPESDEPSIMLAELCKTIDQGEVRCPSPEVLTRAIRKLFPSSYFPAGTEIAINERVQSSWYADNDHDWGRATFNQVLWYRRRLTRYIVIS